MASDKEIVKVDYIEKETWDTLLNGGGGGGAANIFDIPVTLAIDGGTVTGTTTASFAEAAAAVDAGDYVRVVFDSTAVGGGGIGNANLFSAGNDVLYFSAVVVQGEGPVCLLVGINADGTVTVGSWPLAVDAGGEG